MLGWGVYVGGVQWLVWVIQIVSLVVGLTEWKYLTRNGWDGFFGMVQADLVRAA